MPQTQFTLNTLKHIGTMLTTIITIIASLWFFGKPAFDREVESRVKEYVSSAEYKQQLTTKFEDFLESATFQRELDTYLAANNSANQTVSLRKLLSVKMNIPQEQVADKVAELYTVDRRRLINLLRGINQLYPELNVWDID